MDIQDNRNGGCLDFSGIVEQCCFHPASMARVLKEGGFLYYFRIVFEFDRIAVNAASCV